jgi:hypothetical protein
MHPYPTEMRPIDPRYGAPPSAPPPPSPARGVPVFVWVLIAAVVLVVGLASAFTIGIVVGARAGSHVAPPAEPAVDSRPGPALPPPRRDVPAHDVAILTGCTSADLDLVENRISQAIELGAPTYNRGDFLGCFTTYERTARDIESRLPSACKGPAAALANGRAKAATLTRASDKAWAMRDAFDGMLDVIDRSR